MVGLKTSATRSRHCSGVRFLLGGVPLAFGHKLLRMSSQREPSDANMLDLRASFLSKQDVAPYRTNSAPPSEQGQFNHQLKKQLDAWRMGMHSGPQSGIPGPPPRGSPLQASPAAMGQGIPPKSPHMQQQMLPPHGQHQPAQPPQGGSPHVGYLSVSGVYCGACWGRCLALPLAPRQQSRARVE